MRILVVTQRWDLVGGSERYAGALVEALGARGEDVGVLCARGSQRASAAVTVAPELEHPRGAGLARHVRRLRPDRILLLSRISAPISRLLRGAAPVVRFVQDHTLFCPGLNKQYEDGELCQKALGAQCLERYYLRGGCSGLKITGPPSLRFPLGALAQCERELEETRRMSRVLVASEYMRCELLAAGLSPERIEVLPYFTRSKTPALPPGDLPAATAAFLAGSASPILFAPARLTLPDKGIDYLLSAFARVRHDSRLVIAGEGPARDWLESKARDEGLRERVHFSGWLSPAAIETLYSKCTLALCPSVWNEPFGLVGLEAMAWAKPVVAFAVGGIPEWLVDGETGRLVERKDCDGFAQAIDALLESPADALRLGEGGARRLRDHFGEDRHVDRLLEVLR